MEIERKFLTKTLPEHLESYPHKTIRQAYLCTNPVVRIRQHGNDYILTYKGRGMMVREEYNLPLTREAFEHMLPKADGNIIEKTRYEIPYSDNGIALTIELDIFTSPKQLVMAEVEFPDEDTANAFTGPDWFDLEVTNDPAYHNSNMI